MDPMNDTTTSGSNTRIGSFKNSASNMSHNTYSRVESGSAVTNNQIDKLIAESVNENFKLIKKGTGNSLFPAPLAFEFSIQKTDTATKQRPFQRQRNLSQSNTAVKPTQTALKPGPNPSQSIVTNQSFKQSGFLISQNTKARIPSFGNSQQQSLLPMQQAFSETPNQISG